MGHRLPQFVEDAIEFNARRPRRAKFLWRGEQSFKHFADGGVAQSLRTRERARVAPQKGKFRPDRFFE
jgi:hypothetical protein